MWFIHTYIHQDKDHRYSHTKDTCQDQRLLLYVSCMLTSYIQVSGPKVENHSEGPWGNGQRRVDYGLSAWRPRTKSTGPKGPKLEGGAGGAPRPLVPYTTGQMLVDIATCNGVCLLLVDTNTNIGRVCISSTQTTATAASNGVQKIKWRIEKKWNLSGQKIFLNTP